MKGSLTFCCGTGRTGKTVVAEALETYGWKRHKSPTRDFFRSVGVMSETDLFTRSQEERGRIQRDYFEFFLEDCRKVANSDLRGEVILERSPMCNMAYLLYHNPSMGLRDYLTYLNRVSQLFEEINNDGWFINVMMFPFPTPWMLEKSDTDEFRHSWGAKDVIIHSLAQNLTYEISQLCDFMYVLSVPDVPPQDRAKEIATFVAQSAMTRAVDKL